MAVMATTNPVSKSSPISGANVDVIIVEDKTPRIVLE